MKSIANEIMGTGSPLEDSRKRLLEAKRKIYLKICAQLAKERLVVEGACPRTRRNKPYEYGYHLRECH